MVDGNPNAPQPLQPCEDCSDDCVNALTCTVRKASPRPGRYGVLIGQPFGEWVVVAHLVDGYVEVRCSCGRVCERTVQSIVSGESTRCAECARQRASR